MMSRFENLSPREKVMVLLMLGLIILFILWQFILAPLRSYHSAAEQSQIKAQNDLAFLEQNIGRLNNKATPKGSAPFSRMVLINMTRDAGIDRVSRIQPQPNGDIKVWIDDALTPQIFTLLKNIEAQYATRVTGAHMTRQDNGFISAQISFSAAAGT